MSTEKKDQKTSMMNQPQRMDLGCTLLEQHVDHVILDAVHDRHLLQSIPFAAGWQVVYQDDELIVLSFVRR